MKLNKNELDVDFIGGQGPLTKAEEKAISEFIMSEKTKRAMKKKAQNHGKRKGQISLHDKHKLLSGQSKKSIKIQRRASSFPHDDDLNSIYCKKINIHFLKIIKMNLHRLVD